MNRAVGAQDYDRAPVREWRLHGFPVLTRSPRRGALLFRNRLLLLLRNDRGRDRHRREVELTERVEKARLTEERQTSAAELEQAAVRQAVRTLGQTAAADERADSEPPRRIAVLPDFKQRAPASAVTLGLLS